MGTTKSKRRVKIVESIASAISSKKIFDTIDYRNRNEDYIKQYMHQPLISELEALYEDLELSNYFFLPISAKFRTSRTIGRDPVKHTAQNDSEWYGK